LSLLHLFIIRHGKAESDAETDFDRTLASRGLRQSLELARQIPAPDSNSLALISPAQRTLQTSTQLLEGWGLRVWPQHEIVAWGYLASAEAWHHACNQAPETVRSIYVIGHNPGLSEWAADLIGERRGAIHLATAEAIHITFDLPEWCYLSHGTGLTAAWLGRSPM